MSRSTLPSTRSPRAWRALIIVNALAVTSFMGGLARGQLAVVHTFDAPAGDQLSALTQASDGSLFATARSGGAFSRGAVLRVARGGRISVLHSFDGTQGSAPASGVVLGSDGQLYGTTTQGGEHGYGTAFRLTRSGTLTTLHAFTLEEGGPPQAPLVLASDGNFYAATAGVYRISSTREFEVLSHGALFRLGVDGAFRTLHLFSGEDGGHPLGGMIQARDGHLYGTTAAVQNIAVPHPYNLTWGTVFRLTLTGEFTSLHAFNGLNGGNPLGRLLEAEDGTLYGTTSFVSQWQGPSSYGTVFRVSPTGAFTSLYTFTLGASDGWSPEADLVAADGGSFYGTTSRGATHDFGAFFRVSPSGQVTTLRAFSARDGRPTWHLSRGRGGTLEGASRNTVFRLTPAGELRVLSRVGYVQGAGPGGGLLLAGDGSVYGTTTAGGEAGYGTVYRLTPDGELRVFYSFETEEYVGELTEGRDGALYGASGIGGNGWGSIMRLTKRGDFRHLHVFDDVQGSWPIAPLSVDKNGTLYGATSYGGAYGRGTVFRLTTSGVFTSLHSFGAEGDGASPSGRLVQGSDGSFYGTTLFGGLYDRGVAYGMTRAGALTIVHSFGEPSAAAPNTGLVRGRDGDWYGTTTAGGTHGNGTVYQLTPDGELIELHAFKFEDPANGWSASTELVVGGDGSLYGATARGGAHLTGTLFRLTGQDEFTILHSFSAAEGAPNALVQNARRRLYGTTYSEQNGGMIFRFDQP